MAIACSTQRIFERLLKVMGRQDINTNPIFKDVESRVRNCEKIDSMVGEWTSKRKVEEIIQLLDEAEVPTSPINSVKDLLSDPHVQFRENTVEISDPSGKKLKIPGITPKLSLSPGNVRSPAPYSPGQDNEEIYCDLLSLTPDELRDLREKRII